MPTDGLSFVHSSLQKRDNMKFSEPPSLANGARRSIRQIVTIICTNVRLASFVYSSLQYIRRHLKKNSSVNMIALFWIPDVLEDPLTHLIRLFEHTGSREDTK